MTPIRATWSFFSEVKIQDLKVSLELKMLYICYIEYYIYIKPKKQFKVDKVPKTLGRALPPSPSFSS